MRSPQRPGRLAVPAGARQKAICAAYQEAVQRVSTAQRERGISLLDTCRGAGCEADMVALPYPSMEVHAMCFCWPC